MKRIKSFHSSIIRVFFYIYVFKQGMSASVEAEVLEKSKFRFPIQN